jgi:hypothetical protein
VAVWHEAHATVFALCTLRLDAAEKPFAARAREARDPCWVADGDRVRGHVARDDRAGADHRERPNANGRDEHRSSTDRRAVAHVRAIPIRRA